MVRTEDLIFWALPLFASADAVALVERYGRDLIWSWLRAKISVLGLDFLDGLRIRLFRLRIRLVHLRIRLVSLQIRLVSLRRGCTSRGLPNRAGGSRARWLIRGRSI